MTTALIPRRLTVSDVAEALRVPEKNVLRWIASAELKAINVVRQRGKKPRWRIDPDDLRAFEAARSSTANVLPKVDRQKRSTRGPGFIEYV